MSGGLFVGLDNTGIDLLAVNLGFSRRFEANLDLIALHRHHRNANIIANRDAFTYFSRQDEHVTSHANLRQIPLQRGYLAVARGKIYVNQTASPRAAIPSRFTCVSFPRWRSTAI